MNEAIKFNTIRYKPILLSEMLKRSLYDTSYVGELEYFDNPVHFQNKVRLNLDKKERLSFLNNFTTMVVEAIFTLFFYTHDHLSSRTYNDAIIADLEVIEDGFVEIFLELDHISFYKSKLHVIEKSIFILQRLTQLGGARAVLKNNALDLMINIKFFMKYFEAL